MLIVEAIEMSVWLWCLWFSEIYVRWCVYPSTV